MLIEIAYQWGRFIYQWGKFAWWVSHTSPEVVATVCGAIMSAFVTAILAILTYYNVKATSRQARAMLQPALKIETTFHDFQMGVAGMRNTGSTEAGKGVLELLNLGDHPVVLLDVTCSAHPFARPSIVKQVGWLDEQVVYPGELYRRVVPFDFTNELSEEVSRKVGAGYEFRVVASDLSREIFVTYILQPVVGRMTTLTHQGVPWRVRLKYRTLGIKRVWYHFKHGAMLWLIKFGKKS